MFQSEMFRFLSSVCPLELVLYSKEGQRVDLLRAHITSVLFITSFSLKWNTDICRMAPREVKSLCGDMGGCGTKDL